ncbi:MAG: L-alanine-DL-glutamate epimerase [Candidatus Omnitrophica bacterium]|nr:L-alanine-DL-glutamate epimerase [Candidatus Omnitrophota bacterium]MCM8806778.1 L-alanine-DL-glutamate epimerase [Candidatus Omnitrophota bacterium]
MKIQNTDLSFEIEEFKKPLGFKGKFLTGAWQSIVYLESENNYSIGLGTQSVLWADSNVFSENSEEGGNALMFSTTQYALKILKDIEIENPVEIFDYIFKEVHKYAKKITGRNDLRETFTLNSLVPVDNALWILYAKEKKINNFFDMIPEKYKYPFKYRHQKIACVPLISYAISLEEIEKMINEGFFVLKIKIGSDPANDGDREKMLNWDKERIRTIHEKFKNYTISFTKNGKIPYYFDANGRYDSKDRLMRLIDFLDKIKALEQVIVIEEPFPENMEIDISDIPVRIVADESAHTDKDVIKRSQMGYKGVALKPIAKTLSMTLKIINEAEKRNMDYFCADLTVIPVLVEWNKIFSSGIKTLPELKIPIVESNGFQYYKNWEKLLEYHPFYGKKWVLPENGIFNLNEEFFKVSGGIFETSEHYKKIFIQKGVKL